MPSGQWAINRAGRTSDGTETNPPDGTWVTLARSVGSTWRPKGSIHSQPVRKTARITCEIRASVSQASRRMAITR